MPGKVMIWFMLLNMCSISHFTDERRGREMSQDIVEQIRMRNEMMVRSSVVTVQRMVNQMWNGKKMKRIKDEFFLQT